MNADSEELQRLIAEMAVLIDQDSDVDPQLYTLFFQHPELGFQLIELINNLDEAIMHDGPPIYSACLYAFDICVAQLQAATESHNKIMAKSLIQLMNRLAELINLKKHSLSYWLPVLNAFYEVHADLTPQLQDAYFELAYHEEEQAEGVDEGSHLDSIRDLIQELKDLSAFEIAENFFAQSYAMPPDFFAELLVDLYSIPEGKEIALLTLLHPKIDVREFVVAVFDQLMDNMTISSISLSRLQAIKYWYPETYHPMFERWIKAQRKKGVVFERDAEAVKMSIKATEVDGTGSQGIFIHLGDRRKNRLAGLLLKYELGLKDTWLTPYIPAAEVKSYYQQAFEESVTLRDVDNDYFQLMAEHFLALTIEQGQIPNVHLLEIQELSGLKLRPKKLDLDDLFEQLSVQITPFTEEAISESLLRSKSWLKSKAFTESWYLESPLIDKIVNHNSSFVDGVKVCQLDDAIKDVFAEEMELNRDKWQFHFLWIALWMKAKERKNEKIWRDSFLIAYVIHEGRPLNEIPVMQEICRQTVINSIETMQERRTHLNQE